MNLQICCSSVCRSNHAAVLQVYTGVQRSVMQLIQAQRCLEYVAVALQMVTSRTHNRWVSVYERGALSKDRGLLRPYSVMVHEHEQTQVRHRPMPCGGGHAE